MDAAEQFERTAADLWAGLRDKTKNVIRRARERLVVREIDDVNLFANFYKNNLAGVESGGFCEVALTRGRGKRL